MRGVFDPPPVRHIRHCTAALGALCLLLWMLNPPAAWAAVPANAGTNSQKLLQYMNAEHSARDLDGMSRSASLDATAQKWAQHLASEARMYHSSDPAKGAPFNWRAENLAYWEGHEPFAAEKIHNWWMNSKVHRNNIVHPGFTHVGFGMACEIHDGVPWVFAVAHFGGPSGPIENSDPGQASGQGSTPGMTCAGGSSSEPDPPPPPEPAAEPGPSQPGKTTDNSAGELIDQMEANPEPTPPDSPATGAADPSRSAPPVAKPKASASPSPQTSSSPDAAPAAEAGPPQATAAQLQGEQLGAVEQANGPLWIVAGLFSCGVAIGIGRRSRWQPKHSASRRHLL
ncbi:MAG: CAP domain-containing protein [Actinomycetota bacterium]